MPVAGNSGEKSKMAHSHDQTYIARLGFADPDKKTSEHDIACQYIAQPQIAIKILNKLFQEPRVTWTSNGSEFGDFYCDFEASSFKPYYEHALVKGDGQYKTSVGFLDLVLTCQCQKEARKLCGEDWIKEYGHSTRAGMIAEVKIHLVSAAEIVRQVRFYREFIPHSFEDYLWIVPTRFPFTEEDVTMLQSSGITPFRLGKGFDVFKQQIIESKEAEVQEI